MKHYTWNGHEVTVTLGTEMILNATASIECFSCSVPYVICEALRYMANNNVRHLVVDGSEIKFKY